MALLRLSDFTFADEDPWRPITDAQVTAARSEADILMFGGSTGPGKTSLIVADATRECDKSTFRGLIFRESFPQLEKSVLPEMRKIYPQFGAYYRQGAKSKWIFPSGAEIATGYISGEEDINNYQGGEYSYIGVDESTHHPESHIRKLLPWWRTTDPTLKKRIRLATNPGGEGMDWHLKVFLRGYCPFHFPEQSAEPGERYSGAEWPSDGKPIPGSVCFVPGKYSDHGLHGPEYLDLLRTQSGPLADQFLLGCWCNPEGGYFKFLQASYKLPVALAGDNWWKRHIISVDYGFGDSWAAAGLYVIDEPTIDFPEGRMWKIGELPRQEMGSEDFAHLIGTAFIEPTVNGERRQFEYAVFDPATDSQTGTGRSNFDIMVEILSGKYGVSCIKASKGPGSRISNAQNLYRLLKAGPPDKPEEWGPGQLVITDACPATFSSLQTRLHDKDKPGDVKKVKGKPADDLYDETSYAANTFYDASEKPREVEINSRLKKFKDGGMDEHSLVVHRLKMEREIPEEEAPVMLGRRRGVIVKPRR